VAIPPLVKGTEPFAAGLRRHFREIRSEALALVREDYQPWPLLDAYTGDWRVFPLFLRSWPAALVVDAERNEARCPRTVAALRGLGACAAAFSWLEPGTNILPHRDAPDPGVVRTHLGVSVGRGAFLRVGDEWWEWTDGEALSFDGQLEHEVLHLGRERRIVLLADVPLGAAAPGGAAD